MTQCETEKESPIQTGYKFNNKTIWPLFSKHNYRLTTIVQLLLYFKRIRNKSSIFSNLQFIQNTINNMSSNGKDALLFVELYNVYESGDGVLFRLNCK